MRDRSRAMIFNDPATIRLWFSKRLA